MDNNGQQLTTMDNNGQQWITMDNDGQQWTLSWTTIRGATCISDAVFKELELVPQDGFPARINYSGQQKAGDS